MSAHARRPGEAGQAMPSIVAVVSVIAVVAAMVAFFARGSDEQPAAARDATGTASSRPATRPATEPAETSSPRAGVRDEAGDKKDRKADAKADKRRAKKKRKDRPDPDTGPPDVYVEVYNNTSISGLAADTAAQLQDGGWQVVGVDNWRGDIPQSTVYYPDGMAGEARQLARDLGFGRVRGAVPPMKFDRLTVILTPDAA